MIDLKLVQASCISCCRIDSWPKLYLLLWLYEHRPARPSCEELAQRLYLGDLGMVKQMLSDLRGAGFLTEDDGRCALSESPDILACLDTLHRTFTDPLARQGLIDRLRQVGAQAAEL